MTVNTSNLSGNIPGNQLMAEIMALYLLRISFEMAAFSIKTVLKNGHFNSQLLGGRRAICIRN